MALWYTKRERENGQRKHLRAGLRPLRALFVRHMVERCGGNKAEAARRLGVSYANGQEQDGYAGRWLDEMKRLHRRGTSPAQALMCSDGTPHRAKI